MLGLSFLEDSVVEVAFQISSIENPFVKRLK
jgi:hypothetical protein